MREESKNKLPPIIVDYIERLRNTKQSSFQRELYCSILENIRDACDIEIKKYNLEKSKNTTARR